MFARSGKCRLGRIYARDRSPTPAQLLAQDAAAAADVHNPLAGDGGATLDVIDAQRVDGVQRGKGPFGVPPVVGNGFEAMEASRDVVCGGF